MRLEARLVAAFGVAALGLANLGRVPGGALGGRESPLVLADIAIVIIWIFLAAAIVTRQVQPALDRVMTAVLGFAGVAAISSVLAIARHAPPLPDTIGIVAYLARWIAYFGWYPFVVLCLTRTEAERTWRWVEIAILLVCAFGILQSAFMPGFAQMIHASESLPDWDKQGRRLVSTLLDPNFAGIFIVVGLLFRLARLTEGERESGVTLGVLATGLLLTVSRSSILALMAGIFVLGATRGLKLRVIKLFLAGALLLLPFLSLLIAFAQGFNKLTFDPSAAQRLIPWIRGMLLIRDHPFFGVGFNALQHAQRARGWRLVGGADTSFDGGLLFVAVMTGLIGLFFYVRILHRVWVAARAIWRDGSAPATDRAHASATVASGCAVLVHSLFVNSLLLPFVMQILWIMWARLAHAASARRARAAVRAAMPALPAAVALPLLLLAAGCDPCAGTAACGSNNEVAVAGAIVHHTTGSPLAGVEVEAAFADGTGGAVVRTTTTDSDGQWELRAPVASDAPVTATFTVTPQGGSPYVVPPFDVRRVASAGDAVHVGHWSEIPVAHFQGVVTFRGSALSKATVTFVRDSGVAVTLDSPPTRSNAAGNFQVDLVGPEIGTAVGTLTISHNDRGVAVYRGVAITLTNRWALPVPSFFVDAAPRLAYAGSIFNLGRGEYVEGAKFTFTRTGGIATAPSAVTVTAGPGGFFAFELLPGGRGSVEGDVTITLPTGASQVYPDVSFATYDSLFVRHSGVWLFGEAWRWYVDVRRTDGSPAPGVPVTFRRTGGLAITPNEISGTTDANGRFPFEATVSGTGIVVGDIVASPPGAGQQAASGVRLRTNPDYSYHPAGVLIVGAATPP